MVSLSWSRGSQIWIIAGLSASVVGLGVSAYFTATRGAYRDVALAFLILSVLALIVTAVLLILYQRQKTGIPAPQGPPVTDYHPSSLEDPFDYGASDLSLQSDGYISQLPFTDNTTTSLSDTMTTSLPDTMTTSLSDTMTTQ